MNLSTSNKNDSATVLKSNPAIIELLEALKNAFDLPKLRHMLEELDKSPKDRTQFEKLALSDSAALKEVLMLLLSVIYEKFFNDLDPTKPDSVEKLRTWNNQILEFPISVKNLDQPNPRFVPKAMAIMRTGAGELKTVEEVDKYYDRHNGTQYFVLVDEKTKNFKEPWTKALLSFAAKIAERDIKPCLVAPKADTTSGEVNNFYQLMIEAEKIINRRILSTEVRDGFLKEFQPVLKQHIEFYGKFFRDRTVARYLTQALDIEYDLYTKVQEKSEVPAKEVVPSTEKVNVENAPSTTSTIVATPEVGDNGSTDLAALADHIRNRALQTEELGPEGRKKLIVQASINGKEKVEE